MSQYATSHRQIRSVNGCGAANSSLNINANLRGVGEGFLIACCNDHDICYETCGKTQHECDRTFRQCMIALCNKIEGDQWWHAMRRFLCNVDALVLHRAVAAFGGPAYADAQHHSACTDAMSNNPFAIAMN